MDYSAIVFDTAPTGHTLRLLQFPSTLEKGLSKLMDLQGMMGGLFSQFASMFGQNGPGLQQGLFGKLTEMKVGFLRKWDLHCARPANPDPRSEICV